MISKIDDVCTKILFALQKNETDTDYAQLQRNVGAGSIKTIKKHVKHLLDMGLIEVNSIQRGMRVYYKISLSKKGIDMVSRLKQKSNYG
jgi:DNA-binding HxlR family transcriptional regulator